MTTSIQEQNIGNNLGTMVCFHKKYSLGDLHSYSSNDFGSWDEFKNQLIKDHNVAVILPIYMYDHSGITISTTPFSCPWDSGQIGFIFVSKAKALKEFEGHIVTKKLKERLTQHLIGEVETYDQYLTGDVFGFQITLNDEELDSFWGYYGTESCLNEAKSIVESYSQN